VTADQGVAPDGTQTADLLDGATTRFRSAAAYGGATSARTLTVYAKTQSGTATFEMQAYNGTDGAAVSASFTATTEWQRFEFTTGARTTADYAYVQFPSSPILFWGYQMEDGSFPTSYIPTVTSQYRYADVAAVQDEDFSTTNLLAYSESFDVGWTLNGIEPAGLANAAVAPDGQVTADRILDTTATSGHNVFRSFGTTYTNHMVSFYIKNIDHQYLEIDADSSRIGIEFDGSNVPFFNGDDRIAQTNKSIESVGNGWYRVSIFMPSGSRVYVSLKSTTGLGGFTYSGTGTGIYLWGASKKFING
jgi:hypothetical protein